MAQKYFNAHLIGNVEIEIRELRSEVSNQLWLRCGIGSDERNGPRKFADASTPLLGNGFAQRNGFARASLAGKHGALLWIGRLHLVTEYGRNEFAEVVVRLDRKSTRLNSSHL